MSQFKSLLEESFKTSHLGLSWIFLLMHSQLRVHLERGQEVANSLSVGINTINWFKCGWERTATLTNSSEHTGEQTHTAAVLSPVTAVLLRPVRPGWVSSQRVTQDRGRDDISTSFCQYTPPVALWRSPGSHLSVLKPQILRCGRLHFWESVLNNLT